MPGRGWFIPSWSTVMPQLLVLIGDPVAHSRSPALHNAAFAQLGLDLRYEVWPTPAVDLAARIAELRTAPLLGANITLPHKTAVIPLLDALEDEAARIGAVNTIYKRADGALVGANTDAPALLEDLQVAGHFDPAGKAAVLLGASGAARAAAYALLTAGIAQLVVVNRTLERAEELLADVLEGDWGNWGLGDGAAPLQELPRLVALETGDPDLADYLATSMLLINATSLGWHADETPLPDPPVGPGVLVYDMVYRPTRLLREAAVRGAQTLDGSGMLLRQAALAFTRWTGQAAPLEVMQRAFHAA